VKLAVTGATGFVGSTLVERAVAAGHSVTALTRRAQPGRDGIRWIEGALDDRASLAALVAGAEAVIHVAGVINAADAAGFAAGNVAGTANVVEATASAGVKRLVHVSSLAAREPSLSLYGASKAQSEEIVWQSGLDWAIVRPPAVYGPGDRETLELFKMAARGLVMLPPAGRLSLLHVDDLADLLLALTAVDEAVVIEPDDARPRGWSHVEFAHSLGRAVGRKVRTISAPRPLVGLAARADRLVRRGAAKLTPDRAAYFCHPDWVVDPDRAPPAGLWQPKIATEAGLAATAHWYRAAGWLQKISE
jgi:nucleoside-diphosphate-sugar epimerase